MSGEQRTRPMQGVLSPVVTPFDADLNPDSARFVRHCRWLLSQDVGLAVFGTNSEGNSLTTGEKIALLDTLVEAGLPPERMMPGTGTCALGDTVELTRHAVEARVRRRVDAAAVLLQGQLGRGPLPELLRGDPARRRRPPADLPLPHPAGRPGADHADADRAAAEGVPGHHRRREGQLRRLVEHEGDAGPVPAARLRRLPRQRVVPAAGAPRAAGPAASRRRRTSTPGRSRGWRRPGSRTTPTPSRPGWTPCAASSRAT